MNDLFLAGLLVKFSPKFTTSKHNTEQMVHLMENNVDGKLSGRQIFHLSNNEHLNLVTDNVSSTRNISSILNSHPIFLDQMFENNATHNKILCQYFCNSRKLENFGEVRVCSSTTGWCV